MKFGISLHRRYFNIIHPTLFVALPCFRHYSKRGESGTLFPSAAFGTDFTHLTEGRNLRGLLFFGTAPCVFIWVGISMSVLPPPCIQLGKVSRSSSLRTSIGREPQVTPGFTGDFTLFLSFVSRCSMYSDFFFRNAKQLCSTFSGYPCGCLFIYNTLPSNPISSCK